MFRHYHVIYLAGCMNLYDFDWRKVIYVRIIGDLILETVRQWAFPVQQYTEWGVNTRRAENELVNWKTTKYRKDLTNFKNSDSATANLYSVDHKSYIQLVTKQVVQLFQISWRLLKVQYVNAYLYSQHLTWGSEYRDWATDCRPE